MNKKEVEIYTDGACSGNPGSGGWCAILIYKGKEKTISGGALQTTNNRMELTAILEGLKALKFPCKVTLYSDSSYSLNPFIQGWIYRWQANGWIGTDKNEVKNRDLWEALAAEVKKHEITFIHVKGHADNDYNNKCDKIASEIAKGLSHSADQQKMQET
jgi:ribonuclease HI